MVTEISAFEAEDGTIHKSKLAALEHDAVCRLKALSCFNHGTALEVVRMCVEVHAVLAPLVEEALLVGKRIADEQDQAEPV